jgi:hypothetical protein
MVRETADPSGFARDDKKESVVVRKRRLLVDKEWRLRWHKPSPLTQAFPLTQHLSSSNHSFLQQPLLPYNYPLLFVIPSGPGFPT